MQSRGGTMILYACDVGRTAGDGQGEHGTLTTQLLLSMKEGRRPVDVFNEVSREVRKKTDGKQVPWVLSSDYPDDWAFNKVLGAERQFIEGAESSERPRYGHPAGTIFTL